MLEDPAKVARLGEAGRAFVEESYGWDRVTDRYEQLLQTLVLRPAGMKPPASERTALRAVRREAQ